MTATNHLVERVSNTTLTEAASGDEDAALQVVRRFHPELSNFARRQQAADPEGTVDVILTEGLDRLNEIRSRTDSSFRAYLYRMLRRELARERQKAIAAATDPFEQERLEGFADPGDFEIGVADRNLVEGLLKELPPDQREIVARRYLLDHSYEEIAVFFDLEQAAVRKISSRGIARLRVAIVAMGVAALFLAVLVITRSDENNTLDVTPADDFPPSAEERSVSPEPVEPLVATDEESIKNADQRGPTTTFEDPNAAAPNVGGSAVPNTPGQPTTTAVDQPFATGPTSSTSSEFPATSAPDPSTSIATSTTVPSGSTVVVPTPIGPNNYANLSNLNGLSTTIAWQPVDGATGYGVEAMFFDPLPEALGLTDPWLPISIGSTTPAYTSETELTFSMRGSNPGRWRVWALDAEGQAGAATEWQHFSFGAWPETCHTMLPGAIEDNGIDVDTQFAVDRCVAETTPR